MKSDKPDVASNCFLMILPPVITLSSFTGLLFGALGLPIAVGCFIFWIISPAHKQAARSLLIGSILSFIAVYMLVSSSGH
jgi:hypothetical protein